MNPKKSHLAAGRRQDSGAPRGAEAGALIQQAMVQFGQGKPAAAVPLFERALQLAPNTAPALHFLGLAYHQLKRDEQALPLLRRSIEADRHQVAFSINLGLVLAELGRLNEAVIVLEEARQQGQAVPELFNNLGHVQLQLGNLSKAVEHFHRALELRPDFPAALNNLGGAFARLGRLAEAVKTFRSAQRLSPRSPEILNNLAQAQAAAGEAAQAAASFNSVLAIDPANLDATLGLAKLLEAEAQIEAAIKQCQPALARHPQNARLLLQMGSLLRSTGQYEAARDCFRKAATAAPRFFPAQWQSELSLPILYRSGAEMAELRAQWMHGIQKLQSGLDGQAFDLTTITLPQTNFYLHYQCENDLEAQARYGQVVTRVAQAQAAGFAPAALQRYPGNRKIRVGFASGFFNLHTIFKLFHGWIVHLDRNLFDTFVFHFSDVRDKATDFLSQHATQLITGLLPLRAAAESMAGTKLDVLIYPDIGMDSLTQMLAALRLAPIQCQSWGHPVTSGLSSMDYFLSSELMEPEGAQAHYHEKLVCLPGLSIRYSPPDIMVASDPPGLPPMKGTRFVCLQSLFKLLPQQDDLIGRIAARVPQSQFLFIAHSSSQIANLYRQRLEQALRQARVDPLGRIHFLPQLKYGEFLGLVRHADIILDSVGWSGGNTTLEALAFAKPIVTLPGEFMRGRHTMAILRRIGVTETIARNAGDFVDLAVRLAGDLTWREQISEKLRQNKDHAYNDEQAIRGLEQFLREAVESRAI